MSHRCVQCVASGNCMGMGQVCDSLTHRCAAGCMGDMSCSGRTPYCSTTRMVCVQCNTDDNCAMNMTNKHCLAADGICVQCNADADCTNGGTCNTTFHICGRAPGGGFGGMGNMGGATGFGGRRGFGGITGVAGMSFGGFPGFGGMGVGGRRGFGGVPTVGGATSGGGTGGGT
jgi:Cys-rich repeat protein